MQMTMLSIMQTLRNTQKHTLNLFHIYMLQAAPSPFGMFMCATSGVILGSSQEVQYIVVVLHNYTSVYLIITTLWQRNPEPSPVFTNCLFRDLSWCQNLLLSLLVSERSQQVSPLKYCEQFLSPPSSPAHRRLRLRHCTTLSIFHLITSSRMVAESLHSQHGLVSWYLGIGLPRFNTTKRVSIAVTL